jgi:lipoprotein NlpD
VIGTRALGLAWAFSAVLGGCVSGGVGPPAPAVLDKAHAQETYVVQPHDTLYGIAWRHDLDYRELARWNNIGADYRLAVGQVLLMRRPPVATAARPPAPKVAASPAPMPAPEPPAPPPAPRAGGPRVGTPVPLAEAATHDPPPDHEPANAVPETNAGAVSTMAGLRWVWPTDHASAPRPVPGGGILLFGKLGQDVRAAGTGKVVYTGSGIRGYGNLIIIKHGDSLLSSYAHNREMLVHEGEEVTMGQVIAHMGTGPHQACALYFEIRVNGKPADPLHYLAASR